MRLDPILATVMAVLIAVAGAIIVISSGESVAVRFLTAIVTVDVASRLHAHGRVTACDEEWCRILNVGR